VKPATDKPLHDTISRIDGLSYVIGFLEAQKDVNTWMTSILREILDEYMDSARKRGKPCE
jgi:hypothetical protein